MQGVQANWLSDGKRLHLNHGPIDLIVEAFGEPDEVRAAYGQAAARFETVLSELVAELPKLRQPATPRLPRAFAGSTARRMEAAVAPLAEKFLTPMAAVAGSVADEILSSLVAGRVLDKAYVNNGGDIALHLAAGQELSVAVAGTGHGFRDRIQVHAVDPVRGIATSGWRGRSFSLGIADAVTVLARTGAAADAAATVIANAVDLPGNPAIVRRPARELAPDNDLAERLVTVGVGILTAGEVGEALDSGLAVAEHLRRQGFIEAAALFLTGESRICGDGFAGRWRPTLPPSVLPDISPAWGEIAPAALVSPIAGVAGDADSAKLPISPQAGEMSGRTEGGNVGRKPSIRSPAVFAPMQKAMTSEDPPHA